MVSDAKIRFRDEVHKWSKQGWDLPPFFWRDDDLTSWSPNLDLCLEIAGKRGIDVAFAAIPTRLTQRAAETVRSARRGRLAVHGYAHQNHTATDEASEYPAQRASDLVFSELRGGLDGMRAKAGDRFLNMFVPPWGRFDRKFDRLLARAGFVCFSGNNQSPPYSIPLQLDCQIIAEHGRSALDLDGVIYQLTRQLHLRRIGRIDRQRPLGLMTHHRTFVPAIVDVLGELLSFIDDSGMAFSNFAEVDALGTTSNVPSSSVPESAPSSWPSESENASALKALSVRTVPRADEGYPGLAKILALLARMSPIALLRFAHFHEIAQRLPRTARVLSAGCGKGVAEVALAMMHTEQRWVAVDADPIRFENMRAFAQEMDVSNIVFDTVDLEQLPALSMLAPHSFDAVVLVEVLMYLRDPSAVVQSLARLLKPSGELFCIEPFAPDDQDEAALQSLRAHTQSVHGGFSHRQLRKIVDDCRELGLVRLYNCYREQTHALVDPIWRQLGTEPALLDLAFAVARLDVGGALADTRRDATAVAFLARAL